MESDAKQFMAAVRLGVRGYLLKEASASDIVAAVRVVFRGEAVCPPQLCFRLLRFVVQFGQGDACPKLNFKAGFYSASPAIGLTRR